MEGRCAMRKQLMIEKGAKGLFLICASLSVLMVAIISVFIFFKGAPAMFKIGVLDFIFGTTWQPTAEIFGIFPMIVASLLATALSVAFSTFVGIMVAVFLAELAPKRTGRVIRSAIDLLAGIPSVVYGFFGMMVVGPFVRSLLGGPGNSLMAVAIILSIMVLPTIISISVDAIQAVPREYKEGALALGASQIQTIFRVILPAAKQGIIAGVVLGAGRAIGETMAVVLVAGNRPAIPQVALDPSLGIGSFFTNIGLTITGWLGSPVRTLTANVAMEMSYASGLHQEALFATGVVLFIFIMILNLIVRLVVRRGNGNA